MAKLLHGHNGRVLANQTEMDAALARLHETLSYLVEIPPIDELRPTRVDIAWNFDLPARPVVMGHSHLRHPLVRKDPARFDDNNGASWRGSRFLLRLYNKSRETGVKGDVLRAEVTLRGDRLGALLPRDDWRNFNALYRVFRKSLTSFPQIQASMQVSTVWDAIAAETPEIRNRILARLSGKPERTFRRYIRSVEEAAACLPRPFSWTDELPEKSPPQAVTVEPKPGKRRGPLPSS